MKRFFEAINRLPSFVLYVSLLILLGIFAFAFPRLSFIVGAVTVYGLYIFFGLLAVFLFVGVVKKWI